MFTLINNGPLITQTDYFGTSHAKQGFMYLSWNAGVARLLVPKMNDEFIDQTKDASEVLIKYFDDFLMLEFIDQQPDPYGVEMSLEMVSVKVPKGDAKLSICIEDQDLSSPKVIPAKITHHRGGRSEHSEFN